MSRSKEFKHGDLGPRDKAVRDELGPRQAAKRGNENYPDERTTEDWRARQPDEAPGRGSVADDDVGIDGIQRKAMGGYGAQGEDEDRANVPLTDNNKDPDRAR